MNKTEEIAFLKESLQAEKRANKLILDMLANEKMRVDQLVFDIKSKFDSYMEKYEKANAVLTRQSGVPIFRVYTENELAKPIEYGEIFIPALHIKFIKGDKSDE